MLRLGSGTEETGGSGPETGGLVLSLNCSETGGCGIKTAEGLALRLMGLVGYNSNK